MSNETKVVKEYCQAITQAVVWSRCTLSGLCVRVWISTGLPCTNVGQDS